MTETAPTNNDLAREADRINNIMDQIDDLNDDLKELYTELKGKGYDIPALKHSIKISRETSKQREKRLSREQMIELYLSALGQLSDTPLGSAALARV